MVVVVARSRRRRRCRLAREEGSRRLRVFGGGVFGGSFGARARQLVDYGEAERGGARRRKGRKEASSVAARSHKAARRARAPDPRGPAAAAPASFAPDDHDARRHAKSHDDHRLTELRHVPARDGVAIHLVLFFFGFG
jgi:hypothetical protein